MRVVSLDFLQEDFKIPARRVFLGKKSEGINRAPFHLLEDFNRLRGERMKPLFGEVEPPVVPARDLVNQEEDCQENPRGNQNMKLLRPMFLHF